MFSSKSLILFCTVASLRVYQSIATDCATDGSDSSYTETLYSDKGTTLRKIVTNDCPDHHWETLNPNSAKVQSLTFNIYATPCFADAAFSVKCKLGPLGTALNGVVFYGQAADDQCNDAVVNEGKTFDNCSGHSDQRGMYHYHIPPVCLQKQIVEFEGKDWSTDDQRHSPQVGWAMDGLPVYGPRGKTGNYMLPCTASNATAGDCVDECGGHWHDYGDGFLYHYHFIGVLGDLVSNPVNPLPDTIYSTYFPACFRGVVYSLFGGGSTGQTCVSYNMTAANYTPSVSAYSLKDEQTPTLAASSLFGTYSLVLILSVVLALVAWL